MLTLQRQAEGELKSVAAKRAGTVKRRKLFENVPREAGVRPGVLSLQSCYNCWFETWSSSYSVTDSAIWWKARWTAGRRPIFFLDDHIELELEWTLDMYFTEEAWATRTEFDFPTSHISSPVRARTTTWIVGSQASSLINSVLPPRGLWVINTVRPRLTVTEMSLGYPCSLGPTQGLDQIPVPRPTECPLLYQGLCKCPDTSGSRIFLSSYPQL